MTWMDATFNQTEDGDHNLELEVRENVLVCQVSWIVAKANVVETDVIVRKKSPRHTKTSWNMEKHGD